MDKKSSDPVLTFPQKFKDNSITLFNNFFWHCEDTVELG